MSTIINYDGFSNLVSGLGTPADKGAAGSYAYIPMDPTELEALYTSDWLSAQIIDVPVADATRKWRSFSAPSLSAEDYDRVWRLEQDLGLKSAFKSAQQWADLYGGAVVLMLFRDDTPPSEPLKLESIAVDSLSHLVVLDRVDVMLGPINSRDVTSPTFRQPEYYQTTGGTKVHPSRVLHFRGDHLPNRARLLNGGWDGSRLQRVRETINRVANTSAAIASLVQEAKNDVIRIPGLFEELASPEGARKMVDRFILAAQMKSINNMILLDQREEFVRYTTSFAGVPESLAIFLRIAAAAADIPATRLLGQSALGLNATGEGDERNYYDRLASDQEENFAPLLRRADEVLCRSAIGHFPDDWESEFLPLRQQSEAEAAAIQVQQSQMDIAYLGANVITEAHVARALRDRGTYQLDEEYLAALEAPDLAPAATPSPTIPSLTAPVV